MEDNVKRVDMGEMRCVKENGEANKAVMMKDNIDKQPKLLSDFFQAFQ